MKKAGQITGGKRSKPGKKSKAGGTPTVSKDAPEIVSILAREEQRLRNRITSFDNVLEAYKGSKDGTVVRLAIDEEIERTNDRLTVIIDLLGSYDEAKQ